MSLPSEPHRYQKHVGGAQLGHPIKVTKSKKHSPGGIFTLGTDYKTREWATFHIDDIDAVPLPIIQSNDSSISKRPVPGELPKYKDIVIPVDVSVKDCPEDKLPFGTIPIKIVSPEKEEKYIVNDNQKNKKEVSRAETRPPSSSQSVRSQSQSISSESQSSKNIFGIRNPMESYSFRGTKLSKKRFEGGRLSCTQVAMNDDDNDIFSLHSYESKASQQESSATLNDLLNNSSNDISDVNADWPAHQIHSRMMGWKLTSPERRQGLLRMLATADLSTASMTEEEQRLYRKSAVAKKQKKNQVLAKRQTEAYENTVSRFAQHQNKEFKFSKNQRDNMKAKVSKMGDGGSGVDRVVRPCGRKLDKEIFQYDRSDPFASIEVHRAFTAEAVVGLRQRQAQRAEAQCKVTHKRGDERVDQKDESVQQPYTGRSQQLEPVSARHRLQEVTRPPFFRVDSATQGNINSTPGFQAVGRNHRDLLNRADRMELLSNARDVERAATISGQVAQMVDDYVVGSPNNFIGAGSPKRGLTGEAYLMSIQSVGNQRKPVPMQTADWER